MARFLLTSGAKFTPFEYDDLVKPLAQMTEAHSKTQEALDTLALEAGNIGSQIGNGADDARARALYQAYMDQVQQVSDDLYSHGYSIGAARGLSGARARYGTDITKINNAIENRNARAEEYRKAVLADPTLLTEFNPANIGLDNWLDNPQYGDFRTYSGAMLNKQGAAIGENLRREMLRDEQGWRTILGGQYYERILRYGYTSDEISQAIDNVRMGRNSNNPAIATLQNAILQAYGSSGVDAWADEATRDRAISYIGEGMYSAIGEVKPETQQNQDYMTAYQRAQLANAQRQLDLEEAKLAATLTPQQTGYVAPTQTLDTYGEKAKQWSKDAQKYFTGAFKDGKTYTVKTSSGRTLPVTNWQQATSLVYSGDLRNRGFEEFGFDIGIDPLGWFQSTKSMLTGKTVINGREYNVRTGPAEKGGWKSGINNQVAIYVETEPGHWKIHKGLTNDYTNMRNQFLTTADYYRKNYKDVYDAALSPENERRLRESYGIGQDVSTMDLASSINVSPSVRQSQEHEVVVVQADANGDTARKQLQGQLSATAVQMGLFDDNYYKKSATYGIRKLDGNRILGDDKAGNFEEFKKVFTKDDAGNINNILQINITPESRRQHLFLVTTTKGKFAVPATLFGDASVAYMDAAGVGVDILQTCLDNASTLSVASVNNPLLVQCANEINSITGYNDVTPADLKTALSTKTGRNGLRNYQTQMLRSTSAILLGNTVRYPRSPAASLTASKEPQ